MDKNERANVMYGYQNYLCGVAARLEDDKVRKNVIHCVGRLVENLGNFIYDPKLERFNWLDLTIPEATSTFYRSGAVSVLERISKDINPDKNVSVNSHNNINSIHQQKQEHQK